MRAPLLKRWLHRRPLSATAGVLLATSAVLYLTKPREDAPYRPGESVDGLTDVHHQNGPASWGIRWRDIARESGLVFRHFAGSVRTTQLPEDMGPGCAFADYDRDGDWDLFVTDNAGPLTNGVGDFRNARGGSRLFRNDGGKFTDVTEAAGLGGLK